jgi:glycoprotein 2-beta-D-xylosyltransferase
VEFVENCMYFQYLLCKIPCEILMEFSSPTPELGDTTANTACLQWVLTDAGGCRHHVSSGALLCEFEWMSINTNKVVVSKGGSEIASVLGRQESDELVKFVYQNESDKPVQLPYIPMANSNSNTTKNLLKNYQSKTAAAARATERPGATERANHGNDHGNVSGCDQTVGGLTLLMERYDYANLWHTATDWFNMHWTLETIGLSTADNNNNNNITIVWLDGHARGRLDDAWADMFSARVK